MSIQSVDRALQILALFSHRCPVLGVTEISRALDLSKGTVHGLIRTLLQQGFLQQDLPGRKYRLGLKIYELGIILAGTLEINQKSAGLINQLAKSTQRVVRVAIWDGDSMVITSDAHPRPRAVLPHQFGPRVHAYCSAIGKAVLAHLGEDQVKQYLQRTELIAFTDMTITDPENLLADLEATRRRGYAIDRQEAVQGLVCIGAPVFQRDGQVAGSISLSGAAQRMDEGKIEELAEELVKTTAEVSRYMGYLPDFANPGAASNTI
ncbi:IclR family transcriptional regulator [Desulfatitalea tepidiphila]|uniref:IclR family transcriptional regulator n=1 Tax=Desulfatitalea tepidiphila TaxID=1185843 RepID=UPI0006B55F15|nr:IclR family transcriptional regulator [Desulfatitalea tepidiphila]